MSSRLRIGVIGAGSYAQYYHLPILRRSEEADLVALHRDTPEKLESMAQTFGVERRSTDPYTILDTFPMDAVIISGPFGLHYDWCKAALERGLHVLVDKPWVYRASEALRLIDLSQEQGRVLMIGYNRRFDPANLYARQLIRTGGLGEIICAHTLQLGHTPTRWHYSQGLGGGPIIGRGSHMADLITWTTGLKATQVSSRLQRLDGSHVFRGGEVTLDLEHQAMGQISAYTRKDRTRDEAHYYGTEGYLCVYRPKSEGTPGWPYTRQAEHVGTWRVEHYDADGEPVPVRQLPPAYTTTEHFIDVLSGRDENRCTGEDALQAVRIIEAAYEANCTGRQVSL